MHGPERVLPRLLPQLDIEHDLVLAPSRLRRVHLQSLRVHPLLLLFLGRLGIVVVVVGAVLISLASCVLCVTLQSP